MQKLLQQILSEIVTAHPAAAQVLEQFGLDYCCGGNIRLSEGCKKKSLDQDKVLEAIYNIVKKSKDKNQKDLSNLSISQLIEHILNVHHVYLKENMPHISVLIARTLKAHGAAHPELLELQHTYASFRTDMDEHLLKEENILFPILQQIGEDSDTSYLSMVSCPIQVMRAEHDQAGGLLTKIRHLTHNYYMPTDGCNTYRVMLNALTKLEQDTHQHVHKENNILFPKVMALPDQQEIV